MTLARTGRSMKNFEIMARRLPPQSERSFKNRLDLLARHGRQQSRNDDAVVRRESLLDDAQLADLLADLDLALFDARRPCWRPARSGRSDRCRWRGPARAACPAVGFRGTRTRTKYPGSSCMVGIGQDRANR